MSSDTMFLNNARLFLVDGKRKVKQLRKPERRKQQSRGPELAVHQQQLPNGEQPNFGHSFTQYKRKTKSGSNQNKSKNISSKNSNHGRSGNKKSGNGTSAGNDSDSSSGKAKKQPKNREPHAELENVVLTKDLKELLSISSEDGPVLQAAAGSIGEKATAAQATPRGKETEKLASTPLNPSLPNSPDSENKKGSNKATYDVAQECTLHRNMVDAPSSANFSPAVPYKAARQVHGGYLPVSPPNSTISPSSAQPTLINASPQYGAQLTGHFPLPMSGYQPYALPMQKVEHAAGVESYSCYPYSGSSAFTQQPIAPTPLVGLPVTPMFGPLAMISPQHHGPQIQQNQKQIQNQHAGTPVPLALPVNQKQQRLFYPNSHSTQIPVLSQPGLPVSAGTVTTTASAVPSKSSSSTENGSRRTNSRKNSYSGGSGYAGATFATDQPQLSSLPKPSFV